jgi:hypothetical protein
MTYAFTIAELRNHDVKALPDGAEYTGNQFAGNGYTGWGTQVEGAGALAAS